MPFKPNRDRTGSDAFTLVELLIAIAIVAALAALLFGASKSAQASAQNGKCLNNLRASGQAMILYFTERNGNLFANRNWYQYPSWKSGVNNGMREYFGIQSNNNDISDPEFLHDSVLTCPAMKSKYPTLYPQALNRGVAINYYLNQKDPSSSYDSGPSANRPLLAGSPQRISGVPKLSAMWILTDAAVNGGVLGSINENTAEHSKDFLSAPHNGRQNVLFFDGHTESLTKEQFRNPKNKREFWGNLTLPETPQ